MIEVLAASGITTVQDRGWVARRAIGLPPAGAVDAEAFAIAAALVGNPAGAAGLELALGGLTVGFAVPTRVAATGSLAELELDGRPVPAWTTLEVAPGQSLRAVAGGPGRFGYLAMAGGIAVEPVLGSRSTYLPTGLGGFQGRRLQTGDRLPVGAPAAGPLPGSAAPPRIWAPGPIRIAAAPQGHLFGGAERLGIVTAEYRVAAASDRMGTRLEGPEIRPLRAASLPSESTCLGAIQVPDDGRPIVVLHDGPTVGGYPKVGVVISADLARFAQTPVGSTVTFTWVSLAEAQAARADALRRLAAIRHRLAPA